MAQDFALVVLVGEQNPEKKFVTKYYGQSVNEVILGNEKTARKFPLGTAQRVAEFIREAVNVGRPVPRLWLRAQAQYADGSPLPGEPYIPQTVAPRPSGPTLEPLPEIPDVVQISDGTWRAVPEMQVKPGGVAIPYAFMYRGEPISGYFMARTRKDLFEAVFDETNDAIVDPENPQSPELIAREHWQAHRRRVVIPATREQLFRATLPLADDTVVANYQASLAAHEAARVAAEAELDREPTEQEIAAVPMTAEIIDRMPAAVLRDRCLSDRAFKIAFERYLKVMEKFRQKEAAEQEDANAKEAAQAARDRLAKRENGQFVEDSYDRSKISRGIQ